MRHLTTVISDELIDSLHTRVITNTICFAMLSIYDGLKFFFHYLLLLERTFGWACSFLFALYLDWFINTRVNKSNAVFVFVKLCSTLVCGSN